MTLINLKFRLCLKGGFLIKKFPLDLLIIFVWSVITLVFTLNPVLSDSFIRTVLGIPVVLFIPGYMLIAALFPRMDSLEGLERTALSIGFSIAVSSLLGLLLNFTIGIGLLQLLLTLNLYTLALIVVAVYRREKLPEEERFSISLHMIYEIIINEFNPSKSIVDRILTVILIFSIALSVGIIYFAITNSEVGEKFTEFYILGPEGKAANYTTANLKYNFPATVLVGVANSEYAFVNYTVQVALRGDVLAEKRLRLGNNESWKENITFVPDKKGKDLKLEFWLFKEDNFTAPYRELHLWVNVTATTATPVATDTPVPEATPTGNKISVKIDSQRGFLSLIQGSIKIQPGDEVIFTNDGIHAVTLVSTEKLFEPESLDNDKQMNYIFKKTGTYGFYLEENKNLNGTIVVEP